MKKSLVITLLLILNNFVWSQNRGVVFVKIDSTSTYLYKGSHALLIGVYDYNNGLPKLPGVRKDLSLLQPALEQKGFDVTVVENPTKIEVDQVITEFIKKHGQEPENRLLIYFAGHGHTVKTSYNDLLGFIAPKDAPNPNKDLAGFKSIAIPMSQIEVYAKQIDSKHVLFVFDACFSGSLFEITRAIPEIISYKTTKPVRQFITSGSADETVPDESIFCKEFITAITTSEADGNNDGYLTGTELAEYLQSNVTNYSNNSQHPQYGKIRNPNLDKGDFVFKLSEAKDVDPKNYQIKDDKPTRKTIYEIIGRDNLEFGLKFGWELARFELIFGSDKNMSKNDEGYDETVEAINKNRKNIEDFMLEDSLKIVLEDSRDFVKIIDYYSKININKQAAILVGICGFRLNMGRSVPKYRDHFEDIAESVLYDIDYSVIKDKNNLFNKLLNAEIISIEEIKRILDYSE